MTLPKVSIMIPTYNRSQMLKKCLDSCLEQAYPNLEIIVSDNASSDNTEEVMKEYLKDKRVRYFRQAKNIRGEQWKKLLYEYATGKYGVFIPDDDYLINENHVPQAVSLIQKYKVDYVLTDWYSLDEQNGRNERFDLDLPESITKEWAVKNIARKLRNHQSLLPGFPSVFSIKKARVLHAFEPLIYGLDYEMGIRFMLTDNTAYLKGPQRIAVSHPGNDSKTNMLCVAMEGSKMFDRLYNYGLAIGHNRKDLKSFRRRCIKQFLASFVCNIWYRDNGVSLNSIIGLYRYLKNNKYISLDRILCLRIMLTRTSLLLFLRRRSERFYLFVRKIYRWINGREVKTAVVAEWGNGQD
jgi:glycosyltransferase involved in cell wall biosynthesis